MEVINPIIMMPGGGNTPSAATFCEMRMMLGNYTTVSGIPLYNTNVSIIGPLMHILQPGDYELNSNEINDALLLAYGVKRLTIKRLFLAGHIHLSESDAYLNFCGVYDRSSSPSFLRCYFYVNNTVRYRDLALVNGNQSCAAVAFTLLYASYCDAGAISLADIKRQWYLYSTLTLRHLLMEVVPQ